jgi:hypothetical protein
MAGGRPPGPWSRSPEKKRRRNFENAKKRIEAEEAEAAVPWDLETFLFPEQLAFVREGAKYATAVCSVRAGKTTACAADLIDTCLRLPGTTSIYITLARSSAERIIWPELKNLNRIHNLKAEQNEKNLSLTFANGSVIYLQGGNDESEIEKIRGLSNVALVYIDEAQAFRSHIEGLVDDIVAKRLYDTDGRCRLIGTPGPVPSGYFFEASQSTAWVHHAWTMHKNPHLLRKSGKTPDQLIAQDCARRGVTLEDPSIQRECFGVWARDDNALLLHYDPAVNHFDSLPSGKWEHILGIDLGVRDSDSLSLLAFSSQSACTYLVEEIVTPGQLTDELARQINDLMSRYDISSMACDTGGLGLKVVEDIKARYGFPIMAAEKAGKMSNYRILDNALRNGTFKAKRDSIFAQDCDKLERDYSRTTPDKVAIKGHSDAVDSCLYAFKLSPAYTFQAAPQQAKPGTQAYDQEVAQRLFEHHCEKLKRDKELKEGQGMTWTTDDKGVPSWLKFEE